VHETGIPPGERLVAKRPAQARRPALGLEQYVGRIDQRLGGRAVRGHGRVEHDAARAPVPQPPGRDVTADIPARRFDPDHLGSVIRQQQAGDIQRSRRSGHDHPGPV
jgi:hypothetical protein